MTAAIADLQRRTGGGHARCPQAGACARRRLDQTRAQAEALRRQCLRTRPTRAPCPHGWARSTFPAHHGRNEARGGGSLRFRAEVVGAATFRGSPSLLNCAARPRLFEASKPKTCFTAPPWARHAPDRFGGRRASTGGGGPETALSQQPDLRGAPRRLAPRCPQRRGLRARVAHGAAHHQERPCRSEACMARGTRAPTRGRLLALAEGTCPGWKRIL